MDAKVSTPESAARLAAERDRIDQQIAELTLTRGKLDAIIEQTSRPSPQCDYTTA